MQRYGVDCDGATDFIDITVNPQPDITGGIAVTDLTPETDAFDLIRATFPAGTLSGAPKVRAMEIIHDMEATPRGPYGGAVGYIAFNGTMDLAITIRTACVEGDRLTVRAGAGIVADSDPERERMETVNKAKAIERALELTAAGASR